jgi:hypothetical protein
MYSVIPGASQAFAAHSTYGDRKCGKEILDRVKHSGSLTLKGTTVNQGVKVDGSLKMRHAIVNSLKVNGMSSIKESTVKELANLNGMLKATQSFFQTIVISTDYLKLDTCTTANIKISPCPNQIQQRIILTNTWVKGSIQFENGQGVVEIDSLSRIDGQVIRGETVHFFV